MNGLGNAHHKVFNEVAIHLQIQAVGFGNSVFNPTNKDCNIVNDVPNRGNCSSRKVCNAFANRLEGIEPVSFHSKGSFLIFTSKPANGYGNSFKAYNSKTRNRMAGYDKSDASKRCN